jgi:phosphate starvation-inducible PhoH-like protein
MDATVKLRGDEEAHLLFGRHDAHLKLLETTFGVRTVARGEDLVLSGADEAVARAVALCEQLLAVIRGGGSLSAEDVGRAVRGVQQGETSNLSEIYLDRIEVFSRRHYITPRTTGQKAYIDAIRAHDVVFSIGPAGTGKTYLAMAMAVSALMHQEISRLVLTRPAVEAGESLGYLPGDLYEKITPYLRPLYDALYEMVDADKVSKFLERGVIEVVPLAYMRGRTLNDAFIILDEAQNSTPEQMKMFLTRMGFDSKVVITGDLTQSDLPAGKESGLMQVQAILKEIPGVHFAYLTGADVVRHELVQRIIRAYEAFEQRKNDKHET